MNFLVFSLGDLSPANEIIALLLPILAAHNICRRIAGNPLLPQHLCNRGAGHFDPLVIQVQSQWCKGCCEAFVGTFDIIERT